MNTALGKRTSFRSPSCMCPTLSERGVLGGTSKQMKWLLRDKALSSETVSTLLGVHPGCHPASY